MRSLRLLAVWSAVLLIAACAGGNGDRAAKSRGDLTSFLYGHSTAEVSYWRSWDLVPPKYRYLADRFSGLPTAAEGVTVGLFSVAYDNTNLPQLSLHIKRPGNGGLLVYNHGHGGLPTAAERFATDFLTDALHNGYDLLIASLPLVGLDAIPNQPSEPLFVRTRDHTGPTEVDPALLTRFPEQHALFEVIDDPDHYMHFFTDGAVLPTALASAAPRGEMPPPRQALPYSGPHYTSIDYVGLSGGATSGLPTCAVLTFDRCVLIAGVMPDYLRVVDFPNFGDAEQHTRSFFEHFTVPDLMPLADSGPTRLTLVYNRHDTCCFADPAASRFQQDFPDFDIRVTELDFHGYDAKDVLALLHDS